MRPNIRTILVVIALLLVAILLLLASGKKVEVVEAHNIRATNVEPAVAFGGEKKFIPTTTTTTTLPPTTTTVYIPPTTTTTIPVTTTTAAAQSYSTGVNWDAIQKCECPAGWHCNTGNGYYGGLQFDLQTWQSVGGPGYPHEHSRETQIHYANILHSQRGLQPWPHCGKYG